MTTSTVDLYKVPHRPAFKGKLCTVWSTGSCGACSPCLGERLEQAEAYITTIRSQYRQLLAEIGERTTKGDYERR